MGTGGHYNPSLFLEVKFLKVKFYLNAARVVLSTFAFEVANKSTLSCWCRHSVISLSFAKIEVKIFFNSSLCSLMIPERLSNSGNFSLLHVSCCVNVEGQKRRRNITHFISWYLITCGTFWKLVPNWH